MKAGALAPDFELPDQTGTPRRLTTMLADGPVVLFFYPAAQTTGCTKESCHFRDMKAEYEKVGAQRVGISVDTVEKQKAFSDEHGFDYPLLSDAGGSIADAYGVKRGSLMGRLAPVKRQTFVIGTDGRIIDIISSETKFDVHADQALLTLVKSA